MPLLLAEADVRAVLSMDDLIAAMETALAQFSAGGVRQPLRTVVEADGDHAFYGVMPAFMREPAALGTKLVSVYGSNPSRGLPSHLATIVLQDPETGELLAVLDGRYITEARTAAVSAVSARHLAREDARVLAILGSGVQARSHLDALPRVRAITEVRVWSRNPEHAHAFAADARSHGRRSDAFETPQEAARGADILALVTATREPVLRRDWVRAGAHICAVGACRSDQREMDSALVSAARVFVDSRAGALAEAGDIVIPIREGTYDASSLAGELGELIGGRVAGRSNAEEITVFKSLGMAVEDIAAARLAWERASSRGLGRRFAI